MYVVPAVFCAGQFFLSSRPGLACSPRCMFWAPLLVQALLLTSRCNGRTGICYSDCLAHRRAPLAAEL